MTPPVCFSAVAFIAIYLCYILEIESTDSPIIGILTLPCDEDQQNCLMENVTYKAETYLPASYAKFIEGGGGQVIPLLSDMDEIKMRNIVSQLNGVLFTGGDASFNQNSYYWQQILNILSYIREFHDNNLENVAIPVWGTCLGMEAILCETAKSGTDIMNKNITANYKALNLNFTKAALSSKIFNSTMDKGYSMDVYNALKNNNITFNEHYYGFTPDSLNNDDYVSGNFTILSTSIDVYNVTFVSLIESKDELGLYWFGSQFHPEKPMYEFATNIPKTIDAIYSNNYFAEFWVNECRLRNNNKMDTKLYQENNLYNFNPYYTAIQSNNEYAEMYLFPSSSSKII